MSTYTGFDMAPSALRWFVLDGTDAGGVSGGPIYGIRGCPRHPDYDSAVSWSDAMAFRQGEFEDKYESGVEKTVHYELPEGHAAEWLRSFFQSVEGHPTVDVNGTIAVAVPDHASPEERDDVLAGLSVTKYANVSLIWRPVAALLGWMNYQKNERRVDLSTLLNRRIFVLDLDAGRPELTELACVRHREHRDWIVPSRRQSSKTSIATTNEFEKSCYKTVLGGIEEWEQIAGGQFYCDVQRAIESGTADIDAWVRNNGAWTPKHVQFAERLPKNILSPLRGLIEGIWNTLGDDDIFLVNGWMARRYGEQFVEPFGPNNGKCGYVEALPSDSVAKGAALFAERLAKGLPTYYDRLPEYSFWDGFKTAWVSMFDGEQEVEPGREYRYPKLGSKPRKLKIEKYADNVSFYVREPNSKEYARRIKTQFAEFLRSDLELSLSAVVWPEKGSARFELAMCDEKAPAIFVSGKTTVREIVLRWRSVDNAAHKEVSVQYVQEHQGYVEPQPVLGRIYDSEDNLRMVEEYVVNPRGTVFKQLWDDYRKAFNLPEKDKRGNIINPADIIASRVGYDANPREPTRGLFGTRHVSNKSRVHKVMFVFAQKCAKERPYITVQGALLKDGMLQQNYCHCGALDDYKKLIRDLLTNGAEPQYNFSFYNAAGYVLGEDPQDIVILLNYICAKTHLEVERGKLWWSFFRMLCWHPECKLTPAMKPLLENALSILCNQDANKVVNGGRWTINDTKYLPLAILYALRIRESGEDLSNPLKQQLIALLSTGLLSGVPFPQAMVPKVDPASRPAGDTLSKYVLRFIKYEDTLADRELGAAMGGV